MQFFRALMQLLTAGLTLYMILIIIRIMLTWFSGADLGRPVEILQRLTDPYLNWWRRFEFLRIGPLDLSWITGLIALSILVTITTRIARQLVVTFGIILAIIIQSLGSAAGFLLGIFLVLALIRLIADLINANTAGRGLIMIDRLVQPLVHSVTARIVRNRPLTYRSALMIFCGLDLALIIGGGYVIDFLALSASRIPF